MNKLLLLSPILTLATLGVVFVAEPSQARADINGYKLVVTIDDVEVPYEIIFAIQQTHQGHTVTNIEKSLQGNAEVFRLRVVPEEDAPHDKRIIMVFNTDWEYLEEKDSKKPAEKTPEPPNTPPENEPVQPEPQPIEEPVPETTTPGVQEQPAPTETPNRPEQKPDEDDDDENDELEDNQDIDPDSEDTNNTQT